MLAAMKCKIFLTGLQHFSVITDHHPLIPICCGRRADLVLNLVYAKTTLQQLSYFVYK